jgi:hypothetical protein
MLRRDPYRCACEAVAKFGSLVVAAHRAAYVLPEDELHGINWIVRWRYPRQRVLGAPLDVTIAIRPTDGAKVALNEMVVGIGMIPCVSEVRSIRPKSSSDPITRFPRLSLTLQVLNPADLELWLYRDALEILGGWPGCV